MYANVCECVCAGALNVSVSAEAVASHASCDNEIVSVPERGRIYVVTRSLLVKVGQRTVIIRAHATNHCFNQERVNAHYCSLCLFLYDRPPPLICLS